MSEQAREPIELEAALAENKRLQAENERLIAEVARLTESLRRPLQSW